MKFIFK